MPSKLLVIRAAALCSLLFACGSSASQPDASSSNPGVLACETVGTSYCERAYACYSPAERTVLGLPTTQAECVTLENMQCGDAMPKPGFCKGAAQTSAEAATACSTELSGATCAEFLGTIPNSVCKTTLCAK